MKGEGTKNKIKWEKFTANEIEKLSTKKEIKKIKYSDSFKVFFDCDCLVVL